MNRSSNHGRQATPGQVGGSAEASPASTRAKNLPTPEEALSPLYRFYRMSQTARPVVNLLPGDELPEPYRRLLLHNTDMTTKLEGFHGDEIVLTVHHEIHLEGCYYREVVLRQKRSNRPVEYGAIEITLNALPKDIQAGVIEGKRPLGGILVDHKMAFESRPEVFFAVEPCAVIATALESDRQANLYGRVNRLTLTSSGEVFAHVVEILPPY